MHARQRNVGVPKGSAHIWKRPASRRIVSIMGAVRRHYERVIVACAFLLLFVNVGFTSTAFSVYQPYLVEIPGVGNVGGSFVVTIRTCVAFVCMFFTGAVFKRLNPRIGFFAATACTVLSFFVFSSVQTMAGLCVASVLAGVGYGFGGMVASTYLIGNWFKGKVGSVSGVVTMGSGVAAVVVPVLAGWVIEASSLSAAFMIEGMVALAIALVVLYFVRMTPYEMGLEPIGAAPEGDASAEGEGSGLKASATGRRPKSPKAPERSRHPKHLKVRLSTVPLPKGAYVAMMFAIVLLGGVSVAGYNYFGILLTSNGIDPVVAAAVISVAGVFLTLSKFAVGKVCDRFGTFAGSAVFFFLLLSAMVLCSLIGHGGVSEAAFAAVILGIGMPLGTTGVSLWSLELSSPDQMLKTIRHFQLAYAFGGFVFNMMPGVLAQATGNYNSTYDVLSVMTVVCAVIVLWVYAHHILRARREYDRSHI